MSSDPRSDFPPFESPSRFRWVPPLMIGLALGGAVGCLATFVLITLAKSRSSDLAAERFNTSTLLSAVPGSGDVTFPEDNTTSLGRTDRRGESGSAVRRRIRLQGSIPKDADPNAFAQQLVAQIDAELSRQGAFQSGGSSGSSSGGNEARQTKDMDYTTRDGRRGHLDLEVVVRNGQVLGTLILTEGR